MLNTINSKHLRQLEQINRYNLLKYTDIANINTVIFEIKLNSTSNILDLSYKYYFFLFLFSNMLSYISYKITPSSTKINTFLIKLESKITNGIKIDKFLDHFLLEKKKLLRLKSVTKKLSFSNNIIVLAIGIPLKFYLQVNFISIKTISILNYDSETIVIKFLLSVKNVNSLSRLISKLQSKSFFSLWNIHIKV
jgi:hypothetical protein